MRTNLIFRRWCVLGCALSCITAASAVEWIELGPAPLRTGPYVGRVSAIAISPLSADHWFIGGCDSGVWRTMDAGLTYTALTDHMPTTSIGALAIDPQKPATIYAGTGEANFAQHSRYGLGIFKSTDNGENWIQLGAGTFSGRCFSRLIVHPQNSQRLFAAVTRAGGFPELAGAKGHPQATSDVGVFRSDDAGMTWTRLSNGLPNLSATDLAISQQNPNVLVAAIGHIFGSGDNGLYRSTDGGNTWTKLTNGLPASNVGRISVAIAPSNRSQMYTMIARAAAPDGGAAATLGGWRSVDGGDTWTQMPNFGNLQATYGWYLSVVTVHPTNANLVWFGGLNVRRTLDGGNTFSTAAPPHVDVHALEWSADGERLVMGSDGGVHFRSVTGLFWTARNEGLGIFQFYAGISTHPSDDDIILGGTQDNGTNRRDGTHQWNQSLGGDGGWTAINQQVPNVAFAQLQGAGNLYRSTNAGANFGLSNTGIDGSDRDAFLQPYQIDPNTPSRMIYGTHRVYESTNFGVSWTPISPDLTAGAGAIRCLAIAPSDSSVVYAATNDGRFLRSDDGGAQFTLLLEDHPGWPRTTREIWVHPQQPYTVILCAMHFGVDQIRRSEDGGQSWTSLDGDLPDVPVNVIAVDTRGAQPVLFAGTDTGLFRSTTDGKHWRRYGVGLANAPVIDILLEPSRDRLILATMGRGVWQVEVGLLGDMNCNGAVNVSDIAGFLLALTDPADYAVQYPDCLIENADINGDNAVSVSDIGAFVELLTHSSAR